MSTPDPLSMVLLRALARDVAHELRGPIQSILVNLEVLRRRAQQGDSGGALEHADIIEEEIRRIHALSDAFLGLLRPAEVEPRVLAAESMIAGLDPLTSVHARISRLHLDRRPLDPSLFVRVRRGPVACALLDLFLAVCAASAPGATVAISGDLEDGDVVIRITATAALDGHEFGAADLAAAVTAAAAWLPDGGTATADPVSQNREIVVRLRLPRAARLTPPSPQD